MGRNIVPVGDFAPGGRFGQQASQGVIVAIRRPQPAPRTIRPILRQEGLPGRIVVDFTALGDRGIEATHLERRSPLERGAIKAIQRQEGGSFWAMLVAGALNFRANEIAREEVGLLEAGQDPAEAKDLVMKRAYDDMLRTGQRKMGVLRRALVFLPWGAQRHVKEIQREVKRRRQEEGSDRPLGRRPLTLRSLLGVGKQVIE